MWHGHNDMHPPVSALFHGLPYDPPSSLLGGEALLAGIYDAVRSSSSSSGSNYLNTLLLIAFDEAGGTYDHVPPPPAPPPDPAAPKGQVGFTFNRSGQRVPAIAISAWIPERTVVNDEYRHTSLIRTMRARWDLGGPLTARDAIAPDIAPILSLNMPRSPDQWPRFSRSPFPNSMLRSFRQICRCRFSGRRYCAQAWNMRKCLARTCRLSRPTPISRAPRPLACCAISPLTFSRACGRRRDPGRAPGRLHADTPLARSMVYCPQFLYRGR
jgi:hypothetical protein